MPNPVAIGWRKFATAIATIFIPAIIIIESTSFHYKHLQYFDFNNSWLDLGFVIAIVVGISIMQAWPFSSWRWRLGASIVFLFLQVLWLGFLGFYVACMHGDCI